MEENTNENKPVAEVMPEPEKEETEVAIQPVETEVPAEEKPAEPSKEEPQKIVVDLDYDKLADAIIKAQKNAEEKTHKNIAKADDNLNKIASVFSYVLSVAEYGFSFLILVAIICGVIEMQWTDIYIGFGNGIAIALYVLFMAVTGIVAYWTWQIAKKIKTEPDRNFTVAIFSSFVAFAGFAIAGINLLLMNGRG